MPPLSPLPSMSGRRGRGSHRGRRPDLLIADRVELNRDTGQAVYSGSDRTISPNERIGFHADARYNVYDLGLREVSASTSRAAAGTRRRKRR